MHKNSSNVLRDKPVDVVTKYVDEIPAGSSQDVSIPTDYSESFDHYELFLEGSVSKN